jgi:hypothetical protein
MSGDKMTRRFSFALLNLFAVLVASILLPFARAEQWDKETVVTFGNPVEVPGKVLPAGTYIFKIANSQSDRRIVQIFTKDQRRVLATIQAVPDYRLQPTDKSVISFEERPSGEPEALHSWFYPGENYGVHFVYPKSMEPTGNPHTEVVANAKALAMVPPLRESMAPMVWQLTSPPVLPVLAKQEPRPEVLAENIGAQTMQARLTVLPKTAGNYLILPLLGLILLSSGLAILGRIRRMCYRPSNS